eukprot:scaffold1628_cov407-Prasinococcus_capsulatus_cf.AAC.16
MRRPCWVATQAKTIRELESARREKDNSLAMDNFKASADAQRAMRQRDMAIRDRDAVRDDLDKAKEEVQQCHDSAARMTKEQQLLVAKTMEEAEQVGTSLAALEKELEETQHTVCILCGFCSNTHVPACGHCLASTGQVGR